MTQIQTKFKQTEIGLNPEDWEVVELGEIAKVKGGKRLPKGENLVSYKTNHPYIRITDLSKDKINIDNIQFVTDEIFSGIKNYTIDKGQIYISIVGTIGYVGVIPDILDKASLTENCAKLEFFKDINNKFVVNYLKSSIGQNQIQSQTVGAVQPKLPLGGVAKIKLPLPPLPEQKAIAEILSSLDDKIELLEKQNKTLENIGQALFKSWFVDFEGNDGNRSLRNDLVESEMGMIPRGWKVGKVGDYCKFIKGKKPNETSEEFKKGFLKQILIETFDTGKFLYGSPEKTVLAEKYDILMVMDGANSGRTEIGFDGIIGSTLAKVECNEISSIYVYYFLKYYEVNIKANTTGTSIPHTDKGKVLNYEIFIPNNLLEKFVEIEKNLLDKFLENKEQIQTLSNLRDSLLPRLMSGKTRTKI